MCQLPETEMITVTLLVTYCFIHGSLCAYVVVYILFMASPCMHIFCCIHESRDIYLLFPRSSVGLLRGGGIEKCFTWEAPSGIRTLDCWFKVQCNSMPYCDNHMASSHNHAFIHAKRFQHVQCTDAYTLQNASFNFQPQIIRNLTFDTLLRDHFESVQHSALPPEFMMQSLVVSLFFFVTPFFCKGH